MKKLNELLANEPGALAQDIEARLTALGAAPAAPPKAEEGAKKAPPTEDAKGETKPADGKDKE